VGQALEQKLMLVDQVEVFLLTPLQLNLSSLHGQVEIEMDCWVDFLLNRLRTHLIQGAQVAQDL
jgi:hypothetical protein